MFIARAERTDLLQLGVRMWDPQRADVVPAPDREGCILVWYEEVDLMPDAVIVADGALQNFFAWTTTYAPHLTPISAIAEVVEHRDFVEPLPERKKHIGRAPDARIMRGYIGLIHAEVVAGFRGSSAPLSAGLTPFVSTFSWAAFQQQVLGASDVSLSGLREYWDEARSLLSAYRVGYNSHEVEEVWTLVAQSEDRQKLQGKQIGEFLESVLAGSPNFRGLPQAEAHAGELERLQTGPLEARVELFRKLAQSLYDRRNPPPDNAVVLGFALSLISQGSFAHVGLLSPSRISDVRPLLWYGWFDFHRHEPKAASPATSATTLQLMRASQVADCAWSQQDISLGELRVLFRHREPFSECLLDLRHPLRVALSRKAVCAIQPGQRAVAARSRPHQRSLFNDPS